MEEVALEPTVRHREMGNDIGLSAGMNSVAETRIARLTLRGFSEIMFVLLVLDSHKTRMPLRIQVRQVDIGHIDQKAHHKRCVMET